MLHEGHLREDMFKFGEFRDTDVYGILAKDFGKQGMFFNLLKFSLLQV